jgi:nucleotide-binding universal stress UspA family protein
MRDNDATVLIGYDGSEPARAALRRAAPVLAPRPAVVAHVWEPLSGLLLHTDVQALSGPMREAALELDEDDARRAERIAAEGAELAREAGFDAEPRSVAGTPRAWPALLELADEIDAAAIVTGTRGMGGVKSALLGSVSAAILARSKRPVLVVPPGADDDPPPGPAIAAYDGSEQAQAAIRAAARLFTVREMVVETAWLAYAVVAAAGVAGAPAPVTAEAVDRLDQEIEHSARRTAEEGARLGAEVGLETRHEVVRAAGGVWAVLVESATEHRAAAVVAGSHGRGALGAMILGSVSRALVHNAPAPVLVVPPAAD